MSRHFGFSIQSASYHFNICQQLISLNWKCCRDEVQRQNGVSAEKSKKNSLLSQMHRCISSSDIDHQTENAESTSYTSYSCDDLYLSDQPSSKSTRAKRMAKQSSKDSITVRIAQESINNSSVKSTIPY